MGRKQGKNLYNGFVEYIGLDHFQKKDSFQIIFFVK
jgi:hypothetical protein